MEPDLQTKLELLEKQNEHLIKSSKLQEIVFGVVLGTSIIVAGIAGYNLNRVEQNYSLHRCYEQVRNLQMNIHRAEAELDYSYQDSVMYELTNIR